MQVNLSAQELSVITHAMSVAAERFREDAKELRKDIPRYGRLADQFEKQERVTLKILAMLEEL